MKRVKEEMGVQRGRGRGGVWAVILLVREPFLGPHLKWMHQMKTYLVSELAFVLKTPIPTTRS